MHRWVCRTCRRDKHTESHSAPLCPDNMAHGFMTELVTRNIPSAEPVPEELQQIVRIMRHAHETAYDFTREGETEATT